VEGWKVQLTGIMADEIERLCSKVSLTEGEKEGIQVLEGEIVEGREIGERCLVGKLWSGKRVNREAFQTQLSRIWRLVGTVVFKDLQDNLWLFEFTEEEDKYRVLAGRPWSFDRHILVLNEFDGQCPPSQMAFLHSPMWIQVHDMPLLCMTKSIGAKIGASLGVLEDVDVAGDGVGWGRCLRLRVSIDLSKPLERGRALVFGGKTEWVSFQYEKLPLLCFSCGRVVHQNQGCPEAMSTRLGPAEKEKQWGVWLRAVSTRLPLSSTQWSGGVGGYSVYKGDAAVDSGRPDFLSNFRCSVNKGKSKQHDPSNADCGRDDSAPSLRGGEMMGSKHVVHKIGHVGRGSAVQEKEKRGADVPQFDRLHLSDEVEDHAIMLSRGGPTSGRTEVHAQLNVEQTHTDTPPVGECHATCMATAAHGFVHNGLTVPRPGISRMGDKVDDRACSLTHEGSARGKMSGLKMRHVVQPITDCKVVLSHGGLSGGLTENHAQMNVEQNLKETQLVGGSHTMCMETAAHGFVHNGLTVPRPEFPRKGDEVDDRACPLTHEGPARGEMSGLSMRHVVQPIPDRKFILECLSPCVKQGATDFTVSHDSESGVPHAVHALDEVVAEREGGYGQVGTPNLRFWKRQARVSSPITGPGDDAVRVGQKRKEAKAGGASGSGDMNQVVGHKYQKSESGVFGVAEAVQQPRQAL
jgi:hypothetical protein